MIVTRMNGEQYLNSRLFSAIKFSINPNNLKSEVQYEALM